MRSLVMFVIAALALCCGSVATAGTASDWLCAIDPVEPAPYGGAIRFGAKPGFADGYDGQTPQNTTAKAGVYLLLYRQTGTTWTGPTGFYPYDPESPIPAGGSKTWSDIRLWSQDYTPQMGNRVGTTLFRSEPAPAGYWGKLVLDYTPASMNWTGATEWIFPLYQVSGGYGVPALPCPITDDPFNPENVTRMHLTVYTYPVPEPSSLAGIGFALASVGAGALRRRRK